MYCHTQFGYVTAGGIAVSAVGCGIAAAALGSWTLAAATLLLLFLLVLFASLTVTVRDGVLECAFGPGLIRRRIPLERVDDVAVVRTPWYYGWGIRLTPYGWLWNVSGTHGVELRFTDGRRFRIGSQRQFGIREMGIGDWGLGID